MLTAFLKQRSPRERYLLLGLFVFLCLLGIYYLSPIIFSGDSSSQRENVKQKNQYLFALQQMQTTYGNQKLIDVQITTSIQDANANILKTLKLNNQIGYLTLNKVLSGNQLFLKFQDIPFDQLSDSMIQWWQQYHLKIRIAVIDKTNTTGLVNAAIIVQLG